MGVKVLAVLGVDGDLVGAFHHVIVGHDVAVRRDEEARAGGAHLLWRLLLELREAEQAERAARALPLVLVLIIAVIAAALGRAKAEGEGALPRIGGLGGTGLALDVDGDHRGRHALDDVGEGHRCARRRRGGGGGAVDGAVLGAGAGEIAAGAGQDEGAERGAREKLLVLESDHSSNPVSCPPPATCGGRAMVT